MGLLAAETLVDSGVQRIVLISRTGLPKAYSGQNLNARFQRLQLNSRVTVSVERCDVGDEVDVCALLQRVRQVHGKMHVVMHAAGLLADALLLQQDPERVNNVFNPKARAAWLLHDHTLNDELHSFVLFSSIASLFGNVGQTNYSAANAFLDSLARFRRAQNLAAVCIFSRRRNARGARRSIL